MRYVPKHPYALQFRPTTDEEIRAASVQFVRKRFNGLPSFPAMAVSRCTNL
jgi:hypothetical protein